MKGLFKMEELIGKKVISQKFQYVNGNTTLAELDTKSVANKKYYRVSLCLDAGMYIPFAEIKLFDTGKFVDAMACFESASQLGAAIEAAWKEWKKTAVPGMNWISVKELEKISPSENADIFPIAGNSYMVCDINRKTWGITTWYGGVPSMFLITKIEQHFVMLHIIFPKLFSRKNKC
jgi:hypothetical protein